MKKKTFNIKKIMVTAVVFTVISLITGTFSTGGKVFFGIIAGFFYILAIAKVIDTLNSKPQSITLYKGEAPQTQREFYSFNIAGVTFKTKDGLDRQELLKAIQDSQPPFEGVVSYKLEKYLYNDETAVAIIASNWANEYDLGSVPRKELPIILEHWNEQMEILDVEVHGGQITDAGEQLSYGAEVTVEYQQPVANPAPLQTKTSSEEKRKKVKKKSKPKETVRRYVYITAKGRRYHFDRQCAGKGAQYVPIEIAKYKGLTVCQKCK